MVRRLSGSGGCRERRIDFRDYEAVSRCSPNRAPRRGKTDLVVAAELMGHSRLDTTRHYSLPTEQDKADALNHLTTDH